MTAAPTLTADPRLAAADLGELMQSFNSVTEQLVHTHHALQSQVSSLKAELAEANARIRRTEALAALGEMAAGIAHEIRNPLGSIRLYAQLLRDDVAGQSESVQLCERIDRATVRLDDVVREVLAFARHSSVTPEPTDTVELVDRAVESCAGLLLEHDVTVKRLDRADDAPILVVDAGLMESALSNLIRNAVEAMVAAATEDRQLEVATDRCRRRRPGGALAEYVSISLADSGPGVPDDLAPRLFNPFFTTRADGTGLGLSIVHRVVDAHGGHIDVARSRWNGALFTVFIPEEPDVSADVVHSSGAAAVDRQHELRLADDESPAPSIEIGTESPRGSVRAPALEAER